MERARKREEERVLGELKKKKTGTLVLLTEQGAPFDSMTFSKKVESWGSDITFVVGGALGFNARFLKGFRHTLSLSPMTFPHEMARVVLLEQLYRCFTILKGKMYHY